MTTWSVTLGSNASTNYTNYEFDSFCKGPDGEYYGIKSDGLYLLNGDTDDGAEIEASIDLGELNMGTSKLKRLDNIYIAAASAKKLVIGVNGYSYDTRSNSLTMQEHRADIGKGIRATFLSVTVSNKEGSHFEIESLEARAVPTSRRI
jgi:hypothetical protein